MNHCTYFSHTFSSAQQNYNIYDCELLVVFLALEEWHQYLQGTTPYHNNYWPQKPLLCQRPQEIIQTTSQMVPLPPRLWPPMAGHFWNQNGPSKCAFQTRSCRSHPGQWGDSYMSRACYHPVIGPCPGLENLILHPVWPTSTPSPWDPATWISSIPLLI